MGNKEYSTEVSVIMSVYNEDSNWLFESINSILNQTFTDFEFIIINDNPERKSNEEIIKGFGQQDRRIKFYSNEKNIGLTRSLNIGLRVAKGRYIARMDADDICSLDRLQTQFDFLEANENIGVVGSYIQTFSNSKKRSLRRFAVMDEDIKINLLFHNCIAHPAAMIRSVILDEHNLKYDESLKQSQDYDLWIRMAKYTRLHNIQRVLLYYREHDSQITNIRKVNQATNAQKILRKNLKANGVLFNEYELLAHASIYHYTDISFGLEIYLSWLLKLKEVVIETKQFDETLFCNKLSYVWLKVLARDDYSFKNVVKGLRSKIFLFRFNEISLILRLLIKKLIIKK